MFHEGICDTLISQQLGFCFVASEILWLADIASSENLAWRSAAFQIQHKIQVQISPYKKATTRAVQKLFFKISLLNSDTVITQSPPYWEQ